MQTNIVAFLGNQVLVAERTHGMAQKMECNLQEQEGDGRTQFRWIFGREFARMGGG